MRCLTVLRVLIYCSVAIPAVPAAAQSNFAGVHARDHATLYVTENNNSETKGKLVSLGDEAITLQVKKAIRTFTPDDVVSIERRGDSLKNGAIAGAVIAGICLFSCAQGVSSGRQLARVAFLNGMLPVVIDAVTIGRTRIWPIRKVRRIK